MIRLSVLALLSLGVAPAVLAQPVPAPPAVVAPGGTPTGTDRSFGFFTAGALADKCQDNDVASVSYCFAYITAVHDTLRAYEVWLGQREFCLTGTLSQSDLRRAYLTFLSAYPDNRSGQAASVVVVALKQTYPCIDVSPPLTPRGDTTRPVGN